MERKHGLEGRLIEAALGTHGLVIVAVAIVIGYGLYAYRQMPVDAFPDISPIMVPIFAEAHGMAPEEIEYLITWPIESAMNGLPGVTQVKSTSAFGMAVVYIYFDDDVDIYFARQLVGERLASALPDLPQMHDPPTLGPISTGLGQIFIYYLTADPDVVETGGKAVNTYLRELNDWVVKYQLQTVPGVTDILSIGGHVLQYQIRVDPHGLRKYMLSLEDLVAAVRANNANVGGQFLQIGAEEHLVRGLGLLADLDGIRSIPLKVVNGTPVTVGDVGAVAYGPAIRRGVVTRNGEQEVVSGIVLKLFGANTSEVIAALYDQLDAVRASLPAGVELVAYYEQAELVERATWTVKKALLIGAGLVIVTLGLFLGNLRAALIVVLALPLSALVAMIMMSWYGVSANLMSLGGIAIAIGMLGDGAIVMVENIHRHLGLPGNAGRAKLEVVEMAAAEVARPITFSIVIIILVFVPIFTLEGVEGKMFGPVAFTISAALLGSLLMAVIVAPVLAVHLMRAGAGRELALGRWLRTAYRPLLAAALGHRIVVVLLAVVAFAGSLLLLPRLGTEFIPTLDEGSILIGVTMAPSISIEKATETVQKLERDIVTFDAVDEVVSRIGRPEAGSHPHPVNYAEIQIELKPPADRARYRTKAELVGALETQLSGYPGVQLNFTQPIQNAFDELLSGVRAQIAIKIHGEGLDTLKALAEAAAAAIADVPGLADLSVEQSFGQPQVQIVADREACARHGVAVHDILELVELAIGGAVVDTLYLNTRRFDIHVRLQEPYRADAEAIRQLWVRSAAGPYVPLSQVAVVRSVMGPIQINRETNQRRWIVQGNVRGRDMGSVVAEIQQRIGASVTLPPGYWIAYGGQFENQQRAMARLAVIVPVVIGAVFLMLWMTFGSIRHALIIILNVPLALIGGVFGLWLTGAYLSVPASVGFIALFGIAVQNGLVLVDMIRRLRAEGVPLREALVSGSLLRLRPVLATAVTTVLGLMPLLLATGIGSEVQRPLAIVVVFGLTSSTLLTLFVIPAVYGWFEGTARAT